MPHLTRDDLIETVTNERDAGFTYDDDLYARVTNAIRTVDPADVARASIYDDDFDETTCDDAQLVALTVDFHYGLGFDFVG